MTPENLNFKDIEKFRQRLGIRQVDLCFLFRVSRVTYYKLMSEKLKLSEETRLRMIAMLTRLIAVSASGKWPRGGVVAPTPAHKLHALMVLIGERPAITDTDDRLRALSKLGGVAALNPNHPLHALLAADDASK